MLKSFTIQWKFKGEQNDTYRANAFALKCMRVSLAVFFFAWVLDLLDIFIVDLQIMTTGIISSTTTCALAYLYAYLIGIDKPRSRYVIMLLLVAMATVICMAMSYHTTIFMIFPLVCSAQYFDKKVTVFTCVTTCIGCTVSVFLGYKIGLCDANMLLLTYTTSAQHIAELKTGSFIINTDQFLMFLYFVFPRWLIMMAMMPLLNHVAKDIQIRTDREARARRLAEIDGMTELYNRNKYLQDIGNYYPGIDQLAVLFCDVNNLKEVNDTHGHEVGDALLCGFADILQDFESELCRCYRIGGDEFVMVLQGTEVFRAADIRQELYDTARSKCLKEDVCLSVAIGMAKGQGDKMEVLVKEADERMYQAKLAMKSDM